MALERYGLGAIISADEKPFVTATDRARDSLGRFVATANQAPSAMSKMASSVNMAVATMMRGASQISSGVTQMSGGLRAAAVGMLPMTAAVGAGIAKAASFERQMSAVGAITRANETEMSRLNAEAMRMGIVSVYSATQAGEAMEYLGRAGATTDQIIASLQGTMNAAAADSIDLATAADIVAQTVKAMNLSWGQAGHVADVLALTSASANTNITSLGESFKYGAAMAKSLDISLEQTAAIFGKLGDSGLKGSLAGTSFVNMMNKIVDPSEKTTAMMKKWNITLTDTAGKLKPVSTIVDEFSKRINAIPNAATRAALGVEFFGLRGVKAYNALAVQGKAALDDLESKLIASSFGVGAATEMADRRLDNFLGRFTLFISVVEGLSINLFGPMLKSFTTTFESINAGLQKIVTSMNTLKDIREEESKQNSDSAVLLSKMTAEKLQAAGATEEYAKTTRGAIQVLGRMQMAEENLSVAQIEARKRGVMSAFEYESDRRAQMMKTAQMAAAGVKDESQLGEARTKMMNQQIAAMKESRKTEAQQQIDLAFSGAKGAENAQKWLRQKILEEALISNTNMSVAERKRMAESMDNLILYEAERSKRADALRAEIFSLEQLQKIEKENGSAAVQIALGMQDAIDGVVSGWDSLVARVKDFGTYLEEKLGKDGLRTLSKYAVYFGITAAAIVPLSLALLAFSYVLGGVAKMFNGLRMIAMGAITMIKGALVGLTTAFWPIVAVVAALGIAFAFYRKEGESFGDTMLRLWGDVKAAAMGFYQAIQQMIAGFASRWNEVSDSLKTKWQDLWQSVVVRVEVMVDRVKERFSRIFSHWFQGSESMKISWESVGGAIVDAIVFVSDVVIGVIDNVVGAFTQMVDFLTDILEGPLTMISSIVEEIEVNFDAIASVFTETWNSVKNTFVTTFDEIKQAINEITIALFGSSETASADWAYAGQVIGAAILAILHTIATVIKWVVSAVGNAIQFVAHVVKTVVTNISSAFDNLFGGIMQIIEGDFLGGIKRIGTAIFNALTSPIRAALGGLLKLIRKIPYVEEGLKFMGVDINNIQQWLDEGISYDGDKNKGKVGAVNTMKKSAEKMTDSARNAIKVDITGTKPSVADEISGKKSMIDAIGDLKTQQKQAQMQTPETNVNVNLEDKRTLDINNKMCVDGESMNVATARHKQEIQDRAGYKSTPWQRRQMVEHGATTRKAG